MNTNQLKSIGNVVKVEGIRGALKEVRKLLAGVTKIDQDLFEDEEPSSFSDLHEEDCKLDDVGYIFELLRHS